MPYSEDIQLLSYIFVTLLAYSARLTQYNLSIAPQLMSINISNVFVVAFRNYNLLISSIFMSKVTRDNLKNKQPYFYGILPWIKAILVIFRFRFCVH